jgi:hypothetical protein
MVNKFIFMLLFKYFMLFYDIPYIILGSFNYCNLYLKLV